jgi:hypothetical protein
LTCGHEILDRVEAEREDVVRVLIVELLRLRFLVVDDAKRGYVVNNVAALVYVEQIVAAVVATVTVVNNLG